MEQQRIARGAKVGVGGNRPIRRRLEHSESPDYQPLTFWGLTAVPSVWSVPAVLTHTHTRIHTLTRRRARTDMHGGTHTHSHMHMCMQAYTQTHTHTLCVCKTRMFHKKLKQTHTSACNRHMHIPDTHLSHTKTLRTHTQAHTHTEECACFPKLRLVGKSLLVSN